MSDLTDALADAIAPVVEQAVADALARHLDTIPAAYSIKQVATMCRVGQDVIEAALADGTLWALPLGATSTRRIPRQAVDALMARPAIRAVDTDKGQAA